MATANLHINGFYAKCSKVTGRHPPYSYLVGSKGHETVNIFYADANARITQNRGFDGRTICETQEYRTIISAKMTCSLNTTVENLS